MRELKLLNAAYARLERSEILRRERYRSNKQEIDAFGKTLDAYEATVQDFMMLNAGIKNSFVFVVSLPTEHADEIGTQTRLYAQMLAVVARLSQARILADASFLDDISSKIQRLETLRPASGNLRQLVANFELHVRYLLAHYPRFVTLTSHIEASPFKQRLAAVEKHFMATARGDFKMLDRFAALLLALFVFAVIAIIVLLMRTERENRRLRRLEAELRYALEHDTLTGLFSRRQFEALLPTFESPALLLLNIDHFKHINDFYGTAAGDAILHEVAALLRESVETLKDVYVFRLGGDDFGIVLQNPAADEVRRFARALKARIEAHAFTVDAVEVYLTVTAAVSMTKPLLENADLALKYEKTRQRGDVVFFSEAQHLKEAVRHNLQVMQTVKDALDRDAVVPWFQPIVRLSDGEVVKYEALVRIVREDGTVEGPNRFLRIISKTAYYRRITQVMVEKVFVRMADAHHRFSINLSMRDLADDKLCAMLFGLFDRHKEIASRLDIELLESEELDDFSAVRAFLERARSYGCKIAIDDFGSGYSNFAYMLDLPVDILKIDGSLVGKILADAQKALTVRTIAAFARDMKLEVIAEFVEDAETAAMLRDFGIAMAQGYYFGRPSPNIDRD